MRERRNPWSLVILMACGLVLGGFLGFYLDRYIFWQWLNYGYNFGFDSPLSLEFGIIHLVFGLTVKVNFGSVLGVGLGILVYYKM
ncbi:MAG: DUF4321 domain-containing protein [Clostridiales bacterium]|nr:DUF4321 domain-containing protein [Clostridiales bacterium]